MTEYEGLRDYISLVEQREGIRRINGAHWDLEIGCINELACEQQGPLLLFDEVPGSPKGFRVACNVFTTWPRATLAFDLPSQGTPLELLDVWRKRLKNVVPIPAARVQRGPILEHRDVGDAVDLTRFPVPKWHAADGGRYMGTGGLVIVKEPESDWINAGVYRASLHGPRELALLIGGNQGRSIIEKYHRADRPCPIAIAMSPDPLLCYVGGYSVPAQVNELDWAGGLRGRPIEVVEGPETGLPVPAHAEILVEGVIEPDASCDEGPFGEWTGYISGKFLGSTKFPYLMRVKSVAYATDPILLGVRPLKPPTTWFSPLPTLAAGIWNALEACGFRGIRGVWNHVHQSWGATWTVISLRQLYLGHAREVGVAAATMPVNTRFGTVFIVVDDEVDITNLQDVLFHLSMRCDFTKALQILDGVSLSSLFPYLAERGLNAGRKLVFDACIPWERRNDFPPVNRFDDSYRAAVKARWDL